MKCIYALLPIWLVAILAFPCSVQAQDACSRPYSQDSPWNLPIGPNPVIDSNSDYYTQQFKGVFGCDPAFYTYPVFSITTNTPDSLFLINGMYSNVIDGGSRVKHQSNASLTLKAPRNAVAARGSDAQIILHNPITGDEWGFWKTQKQDAVFKAQNGYHYNTNWSGVPPSGFLSRGAGIPYLAGLVRPCEIAQGHIDHALALAINKPSPLFVYPATKSDGKGPLTHLPEGARLQLAPTLTEKDFASMGLNKAARVLARAMQTYGLIVVDKGGHPKIMLEYEGTANWAGVLDKNSIRSIPYEMLQVLSLETPTEPAPPTLAAASHDADNTKQIHLTWTPSAYATRYRILRFDEVNTPTVVATTSSQTYTDTTSLDFPRYAIQAVNHNGTSDLTAVNMQ